MVLNGSIKMKNKTLTQIKDEVSKEIFGKTWKEASRYSTDDGVCVLEDSEAFDIVARRYAKRAIKADREMYKECLELFVPVDKQDEANAFLSSYGSGLAKELQKKER